MECFFKKYGKEKNNPNINQFDERSKKNIDRNFDTNLTELSAKWLSTEGSLIHRTSKKAEFSRV